MKDETWTPEQFREWAKTRKNPGKDLFSTSSSNQPGQSKAKYNFYLLILNSPYPFQKEFRFHDNRRFQFDFAWPEQKIAIEYEGIYSDKSGHTTVGGYSSNCEKYNLATVNGWRVLRYTADNYSRCLDDVKCLIYNNIPT